MGFVFGLMFAGLAISQPHLEPFSGALPPKEPEKVPLLKQLGDGIKDMKTRSLSSARNFSVVGACVHACVSGRGGGFCW